MDLHTDIELQGSLLVVRASGSLVFDQAFDLIKQVFDTAAEKQVNRILLNCLAVDGELSTFERNHLGVEVAAYLEERQTHPMVAIVGRRPAIDGFAAGVARNREVTAQVFATHQET
jgi:hypothetical protein